MYLEPNFKTKKAAKEAIANGETVTIFQPGPFGGHETRNGFSVIEGPHAPAPHTFYGKAKIVNGLVVSLK